MFQYGGSSNHGLSLNEISICNEPKTLAQRDISLTQIEAQIASKKKLLYNKRHVLGKTVEQNEFLENVRNDYKKYYDYIIKEKEEQYKAMNLLKDYLSTLMVEGKLTDRDVKSAKHEQNEILSEMGKIKTELDDIVDSGSGSRPKPEFNPDFNPELKPELNNPSR